MVGNIYKWTQMGQWIRMSIKLDNTIWPAKLFFHGAWNGIWNLVKAGSTIEMFHEYNIKHVDLDKLHYSSKSEYLCF